MNLQLLHAYARERESHLEEARMLLQHFAQSLESRHIRAVSHISDETLVLVVVLVIVVCADIKETIALQLYVLMYLEI